MKANKHMGEYVDGTLMLGDGKVIGTYKVTTEWCDGSGVIQINGWIDGIRYVARGQRGNPLFNGKRYFKRTDNRMPQREGVG